MPGKNDFVKIMIDGKKEEYQKRLMILNLKEAYVLFKESHTDLKIGLTKFSLLRPKFCVFAGDTGTHHLCVCIIHQNVKLMIECAKLSKRTHTTLQNYSDCISKIVCQDGTYECYSRNCEECKIEQLSDSVLYAIINRAFEEDELLEEIEYSQWITSNSNQYQRCQLVKLQKSPEEFLASFCEMIEDLCMHDFIAKQQAAFFKQLKSNLKENECLVILDFSENYKFVVQSSVQGFYYNNSQATVHPFVFYYCKDGELSQKSFVAISESTQHDCVMVFTFQTQFIQHIKNFLPHVSKIIYMSDGAPAQYKNKNNFANILHHKRDFGLDCEWHFFATSHGKGPSDAVGGTVKRMTMQASLQRLNAHHITDAKAMFQFLKTKETTIEFCYVESKEYDKMQKKLRRRFATMSTINGTRQIHAVIPSTNNKLLLKKFSNCSIGITHTIK